MGKRGKRSGRKGGGPHGGGGARSTRTNWRDIEKRNEKLESYYSQTGIIPEEELEAFWAATRRDLPNSFRFTGSRGHALSVQKRLKEFYIPQITSIQHEGNFVEAPAPVPWYPDELAWSMTTPKNVVRRFAPFASFQKFLVSETEVGNISRQEVVSMIPPLFLDVKPGMTVLDMCAAPGSKSAQLMEMIHAGEEEDMKAVANQIKDGSAPPAGEQGSDDGRSTGLLIANDSDYKRAHLLIHQMKRLNSPNLLVTNHDATMYPSIKLPSSAPGKGVKYLKFDRILADVPCSGDGTMRKNSNVWKDWAPTGALGLYATQMRILVRALQLLKVGGRVVYSTCSMNPIENEAVVATAINRCGGSSHVDIIDCSDGLPDLKRKPGLRSWKVMDRDGRLWSSWADIDEYRSTNGITGLGRLAEGMFPPTGELSQLPLERCMRIYPHLQDTGGFFVAVLEKKREIQAKPEDSSKVIPKASVAAVAEELDHQKRNGNGEPLQKIDALDDLVPSTGSHLNGKNATVAESSHQPPYSATLDAPPSPEKRPGDHLEDQLPSKRAKVEDGTEAIIGDRPVHVPPPSVEGADPTAVNESQSTDPTQTDSRLPPAAASIPAGNNRADGQLQPPQKRKNNQPIEEAFKFVDPQAEELNGIFSFYNIADRFPRDRFLVRNAQGTMAKSIYYTTDLARQILMENEGRGIKFVHCGVKMFVKQDAQRADVCRWRIQNDGLQILEPWVGPERVVTLTKKETLHKLLIEMFPKIDGDGWKEMGEIGERTRDISMGCCVLRVEPSKDDDGLPERMVFPLWRSLHALNLMLPKEDRRALLLRLFNQNVQPINNLVKNDRANREPVNVTIQASGDDNDTTSNFNDDDEEGGVNVKEEVPSYADIEKDLPPPAARNEEDFIQDEDLLKGEEEEEVMADRETYFRNADEEDRFNTTV